MDCCPHSAVQIPANRLNTSMQVAGYSSVANVTTDGIICIYVIHGTLKCSFYFLCMCACVCVSESTICMKHNIIVLGIHYWQNGKNAIKLVYALNNILQSK